MTIVTERTVEVRLFQSFHYIDCPSVTLHFPPYINTRTILVHPDNDLFQGRNGSEASINQRQSFTNDLGAFKRIEFKPHGTCAVQGRYERAQVRAVALDLREDANTVVPEGDIRLAQITETGKVDTDKPDVACVVAADLVEERGYVLGGAHSEVEVVLSVKQRAGFTVHRLVREKELRMERRMERS